MFNDTHKKILRANFSYHIDEYRTADINSTNVDDEVNIEDLPYKDNYFNLFLCSHVLEHVNDDSKAIKELYHILKPGEIGICMVPINLNLNETCELPPDVEETKEYCWYNFGHSHHRRAYSKNGFVQRLQDNSFTVNQYDISTFGEDAFKRSGIHSRSVLYVVEKAKV